MKISRRKTLVAAMSLAVFGLAACGKKKKLPEAAPAVRLPQRQQLNL
jgi:predicted small lipoprotein YifL